MEQDIQELIARLRSIDISWSDEGEIAAAAADALEQQAKEIDRCTETIIRAAIREKDLISELAAANARIAELEKCYAIECENHASTRRLAQDRLEQMTADRKQYLDLKCARST